MSDTLSARGRLILALLCIAAGATMIAVAMGIIPTEDGDVSAPMWVLALCGISFVTAGCMVLVGRQAPINNLFASVLTLAFSLIGFWVAVFSPSEGFSGGFPFLSPETNIRVARVVFFVGAMMTFAISMWALRLFLRSSE